MFKVQYQVKGLGEWLTLSDSYDTFARAAMVATALENRGHTTRIVE